MGKDPKFFSMSAAERTRKPTNVTLSLESLERLAKLADVRKLSRSQVIEALIMAAPLREPREAR